MPVFYLGAAVLSGFFGAVSSLMMGQPLLIALLMYMAFGASITMLVAIRLSMRRLIDAPI